MKDENLTVRFEMRSSQAWIASLDNWRRKQTVIPTRADAIRSLVTLALERKQKSEGPKQESLL